MTHYFYGCLTVFRQPFPVVIVDKKQRVTFPQISHPSVRNTAVSDEWLMIFIARQCAEARNSYSNYVRPSVRLFVCLSVMFRYRMKTA